MRELNATQGPNGPGDAGLILAAQYVPVATSDTRLSRLHHVGLGRAHAGKEVPVHIAAAHVRVVEADGSLLRELVLDADRDYQPRLHSSPMS